MKKLLVVVLAATIVVAANTYSQNEKPVRPVNTYSIVCYDSATGQFGAAVQSHWFKVADVIWLEPGVGAVATQSLVDFVYGPVGLDMMRAGRSAQEALDGLLASDPNNAVRQVAMIDKSGVVATHTGDKCIAMAGHVQGINYSCQANLMENNTVWQAMADAFESAEGDLAHRMLAALEAAQAEGGDIRGKQSAAMKVVTGNPTGQSWNDLLVDLRVDDSPEPLKELRRLLDINTAYDYMNKGDEFIAAKELDKAAEAYGKAAELAPGNLEIMFWNAVSLVTAGEVEKSLPIFKEIFAADKNWRVLVPRLVDVDLLPNDPEIIKKITNQ